MNCAPDLIEAYLDEELDAPLRAAVGQHVAACPECSEAYARLLGQKASIKAAARYYNAPPELRQSVRDALRHSTVAEAKPRVSERPWRWLAIAATMLLVASISSNLLQLRHSAAENSIAESVVGDHIRSLLGTHLVDVPSSDQHTVKPWFAGKLDFSPDVKNFEVEGFPLVGGRIEYLAGRRVAALVYRRRQHVINVFTWPAESAKATSEVRLARDGYNLLQWTEGPMTYWAASDLSAVELDRLRDLYRR
jgi:anti-sigma factor RsiW